MDFYKSRNSSSTSSNHSNSSHHSHASSSGGSSARSAGAASYCNLEYCTSSSSLSPFGTATTAATTSVVSTVLPPSSAASSSSCPSSTAKTVVSIGIDELIGPSSGSVGSQNSVRRFSSSSTSSASSTSSFLTVATAAAVATSSSNMCSSQKRLKRKLRSQKGSDDQDPELGFEPPSAKRRQQRLPSSLDQSEAGSVVSSVYASPVADDEDLRVSISCGSSSSASVTSDGRRSSISTEYDVAPYVGDDIPDSPNSPDSLLVPHYASSLVTTTGDDDEVVSATTSPTSSASSAIILDSTYPHAHTNTVSSTQHHGECTPGGPRYPEPATEHRGEPKVKSFDDCVAHYDAGALTPAADEPSEPLRQCPLPALSWANASDVWQLMCRKDERASCLRSATMLEQHPGLQPRMRAILLEWLLEVCEVYKLHRETYYLAVDYLDRYLSAQQNVQKTHLQLIGITCLFVASKVEEIYPPKIGEFAYVTDGACQESEILQHEILLLEALEWSISPVTPMGWLGVYMQLNVNNRTPASLNCLSSAQKASASTGPEADDAFIYPQFSGLEFVQTAQLLDLCSLDLGICNFPYSVIAAAAMSHTFDRATALRCSGLDWQTIQPCARWMKPYFNVVCEEAAHLHLMEQNDQMASKYGLGHVCPNIVTDDSHIIQTHTTTMAMFDRACQLQEQYHALANKIKQEASPATGLICPDGLLTPPASSRKPFGNVDGEDEDEKDEKVGPDDDVVADDRGNISIHAHNGVEQHIEKTS